MAIGLSFGGNGDVEHVPVRIDSVWIRAGSVNSVHSLPAQPSPYRRKRKRPSR